VGKTRNSILFKILTSNSYGLKILQTLFVKPAPVKPFQGVGGRGVSLTCSRFPKWNRRKNRFGSLLTCFFFVTYPQGKFSPYA
jgi:hypothetical protein